MIQPAAVALGKKQPRPRKGKRSAGRAAKKRRTGRRVTSENSDSEEEEEVSGSEEDSGAEADGEDSNAEANEEKRVKKTRKVKMRVWHQWRVRVAVAAKFGRQRKTRGGTKRLWLHSKTRLRKQRHSTIPMHLILPRIL
jgi:hypothetical protein